MLEKFNTEKQFSWNKQGTYDHGHIWASHILDDQLHHFWNQQYSLGDTHILGEVLCRITLKIVLIVYAEKQFKGCKLIHGLIVPMNAYIVVLITI